jgi:hypothetical protein
VPAVACDKRPLPGAALLKQIGTGAITTATLATLTDAAATVAIHQACIRFIAARYLRGAENISFSFLDISTWFPLILKENPAVYELKLNAVRSDFKRRENISVDTTCIEFSVAIVPLRPFLRPAAVIHAKIGQDCDVLKNEARLIMSLLSGGLLILWF